MISITGWGTATLMTFIPMAVFFIGMFILIHTIKGKVRAELAENEEEYLPEFKYKHLAIILAGCLLYSGFNSANRPKLDTTPNQTYEHQIYKDQIQRKSNKEVKEIKPIQDSFDERRETILKRFDYKNKD